MRLFVALNLPDEIQAKIRALHDESLSGARWTKPEQWHITLHFIGEVETDQAIVEALRTVQAEAFSLKLKGIGTFPPKGKPDVLWVGVAAPDALLDLYQQIGNALKTTGFTPDTHPYHPHVTLARFKKEKPSVRQLANYRETHSTLETETFTQTSFTLYQSELAPTGSVYKVLAEFPLSK